MAKAQANFPIRGDVASGFEPVRDLFEHNMRTRLEDNAQLCVYVGEEKVVDLWASTSNDPSFNADSLVNIFSSGKSLESIALAYLVSNGRLRYNDKVADHWPQFAANGKGELTIADVMRHEAGLAALRVSIAPADLLTENIKRNRVGKVIEDHASRYRKGHDNRREYHAVTRGWIVNEIFRRVDANGRTIGEFLRDSLIGPLAADVIIGVPEGLLGRIARGKSVGFGHYFKEGLKPRRFGRRVNDNVFNLTRKLATVLPSAFRSTARGAPPPFAGVNVMEAFNTPAIAMGETPSANAHGSARGLAKLAAVMANGGSFGGVELVSPEVWSEMHAWPVTRSMGMTTTFTQGGVAQFPYSVNYTSLLDRAFYEGRGGYFGWMGLGGSIFQWHPERKIGFAFVPTALHIVDFVNERGKVYQAEVNRCLESMG